MFSTALIVVAALALTEARFGQEDIPTAAIRNVGEAGTTFGGEAETLAGLAIGTLLADANPCLKLQRSDQIVAQLGNSTAAINAAKGLVAAEKNFNPFAASIPVICSDPSLPATPALRGITPKIDPAVGGAAAANALSAKSLTSPFPDHGPGNTNLSVAQILVAQGFANFTTEDLAGNKGNAPAAGAAVAQAAVVAPAAVAAPAKPAPAPCSFTTVIRCGSSAESTPPANAKAVVVPVTTTTTSSAISAPSPATPRCSGAVQKSTIAGLDFGLCAPTMAFVGGLNHRPATEFTFQAIDPLVNKGQEEALNPGIITKRICDQLTNVCNANAAAKAACSSAEAEISSLGTRDASTANKWNSLLGFAGTNITPPGLT